MRRHLLILGLLFAATARAGMVIDGARTLTGGLTCDMPSTSQQTAISLLQSRAATNGVTDSDCFEIGAATYNGTMRHPRLRLCVFGDYTAGSANDGSKSYGLFQGFIECDGSSLPVGCGVWRDILRMWINGGAVQLIGASGSQSQIVYGATLADAVMSVIPDIAQTGDLFRLYRASDNYLVTQVLADGAFYIDATGGTDSAFGVTDINGVGMLRVGNAEVLLGDPVAGVGLLHLASPTMVYRDIDMNGSGGSPNTIKGMADPTNPQDAVTKAYADAADAAEATSRDTAISAERCAGPSEVRLGLDGVVNHASCMPLGGSSYGLSMWGDSSQNGNTLCALVNMSCRSVYGDVLGMFTFDPSVTACADSRARDFQALCYVP